MVVSLVGTSTLMLSLVGKLWIFRGIVVVDGFVLGVIVVIVGFIVRSSFVAAVIKKSNEESSIELT